MTVILTNGPKFSGGSCIIFPVIGDEIRRNSISHSMVHRQLI